MSHIITLLIYETNREKAIILTEATDLAARIAGIVDLAYDFQGLEHRRILAAAETQFITMFPEMSFPEDASCQKNEFYDRMMETFSTLPPGLEDYQIEVCVRKLTESGFLKSSMAASGFDVLVHINFPDREQSVFHAVLPEGPSLFSDAALVYIITVGLISLIISWYLISRIVAPLGRLARAADEIGVNIDAPPLNEEGSIEVQIAASAFNKMQSRLRRLVHGQKEMIGAISHDLKSAITRLHLRAELLDKPQEREGFIRVVKDMESMIQSVIDFLRGIDTSEELRKTDISALLESLCDDLAEEGYPVHFTPAKSLSTMLCHPMALRRSFLNIIDNAIKYGESARVSLQCLPQQITVRIDDNGPGVPENEIKNIIRPFYRLAQNGKPDPGGIGLGLSIAQSIIHAHGGILSISNLTAGGLRVEIELNRQTGNSPSSSGIIHNS
jgi:signal transduction histidine kinase